MAMNITRLPAPLAAIAALVSGDDFLHADTSHPGSDFDYVDFTTDNSVVRVTLNDNQVEVFQFALGRRGGLGQMNGSAKFTSTPDAIVAAVVTGYLRDAEA